MYIAMIILAILIFAVMGYIIIKDDDTQSDDELENNPYGVQGPEGKWLTDLVMVRDRSI